MAYHRRVRTKRIVTGESRPHVEREYAEHSWTEQRQNGETLRDRIDEGLKSGRIESELVEWSDIDPMVLGGSSDRRSVGLRGVGSSVVARVRQWVQGRNSGTERRR